MRTRSLASRAAGLLLGLVAVLVAATPPSAGAQSAEDLRIVAAAVEADGYFVEQGAEASAAEMRSLVEDLNRTGDDTVAVVLLAAEIDRGAESFAGSVFDELDQRGAGIDTVYVVTPADLGARSAVYDAVDLSEALDRFGTGDVADELAAVHGFLRSGATSGGTAGSSGGEAGGGGGRFLIVMGVLAVTGLGIWFVVRRSTRRRQRQNLERARAEAEEQLTAVGEAIFDLDDRVTIGDSAAAKDRFGQVSTLFTDIRERLAEADTGPEMADVHLQLDRLRWLVEATEADLEGRPAPPEPSVLPVPPPADHIGSGTGGGMPGPSPRPNTCVFDPTHRAATQSAWITGADGSEVEVRVCRSCATALERGEQPGVRAIDVGGRPVPAPRAPAGYGGGGVDLPDRVDTRTGDMGRGLPVDLGPLGNSGRGGIGAVLGGVLVGSRRPGASRRDRLPSRPPRRRDTGASAGRSRRRSASAGRRRR